MQWATRIWWLLRYIGFDNAAILEGGWDKWQAESRPTSSEEHSYPPATLTAQARPELFVDKQQIVADFDDQSVCTINALSASLHRGEDSRYGRPGHIPGSVNVPVLDLLVAETREFASADVIADKFNAVGADPSKRIVLYCGGGIAATLDAFLLHQLGYQNLAVYDNSMSEWAPDEALPIELGG